MCEECRVITIYKNKIFDLNQKVYYDPNLFLYGKYNTNGNKIGWFHFYGQCPQANGYQLITKSLVADYGYIEEFPTEIHNFDYDLYCCHKKLFLTKDQHDDLEHIILNIDNKINLYTQEKLSLHYLENIGFKRKMYEEQNELKITINGKEIDESTIL